MPSVITAPLQLRVCAWCEVLIGVEPPGAQSRETTHGLCSDCVDQLVASLSEPPVRRRLLGPGCDIARAG